MMQANWWKLPSLTFAGGDDTSKVLSDFYISVANASTDNEVSQAIETFIQTVAQNTASQNPITSETAPLYAAAYHVLYESCFPMRTKRQWTILWHGLLLKPNASALESLLT